LAEIFGDNIPHYFERLTMRLRILGCSGGIGSNLRTTSMLLDHDVLIDAGTGVGELSLDELSEIDHVFLTHSHLDHIAFIPFMLDSVAGMRDRPLMVYATEETLEALRQHIFNWKIWPDFSRLPSPEQPYMRYQALEAGDSVTLHGRVITALPANHVVSAVGFCLDSGHASLVYTGDTTTHDELWNHANKISNLKYLIIETAFPDAEIELALLSKHLCPSLLAAELLKLNCQPEIFITHLKPGEGDETMRDIVASVPGNRPRKLMHGQVFEF
jgi:ribonuclease BN (tRNA processing enzyme)